MREDEAGDGGKRGVMSRASIEVEGFIAQDAQIKFTDSGKPFLSASVPHTPRRKNQSGQWEDAGDTLWARFTLWEDTAHDFADRLVKGTHVVVSGVPELRVWESGDRHGAQLEIRNPRVSIIPPKGSEKPQEPRGDVWGSNTGSGGTYDSWAAQTGAQANASSDPWAPIGGGSDDAPF